MQASGHVLTNAALAVVAENAFPLAGHALHWPVLFQTATQGSALLVYKCVYYGILLLCASLPDLDQRMTPRLKHRSFTHSICSLLILAVVLFGMRWFALLLFQVYAMPFSPEMLAASLVFLFAVPLACAFHIVADAITIRGVALFWPKKTFIRFLPKAYCIKNGHWTEQLVVACLLVLVGSLIAFQILGI